MKRAALARHRTCGARASSDANSNLVLCRLVPTYGIAEAVWFAHIADTCSARDISAVVPCCRNHRTPPPEHMVPCSNLAKHKLCDQRPDHVTNIALQLRVTMTLISRCRRRLSLQRSPQCSPQCSHRSTGGMSSLQHSFGHLRCSRSQKRSTGGRRFH